MFNIERCIPNLIVGTHFIVICLLTSVSVASDWKNFWTPPSEENVSQCVPIGGNFDGLFELTVVASRKNSSLIKFAQYYGSAVATSLGGKQRKKIKEYILNVAKESYFTQPDWSTTWSPIYVQSNLIRLTAVYITHLKYQNDINLEEEKVLINWIEKMLPHQMRRKQNGSDDSRAASGVALIAWGAVTEQPHLIEQGVKQWREALPYLKNSVGNLTRQKAHKDVPLTKLSLEDEFNLTLAHVIEGYVMIDNMHYQYPEIAKDSNLIHAATDWWTSQIYPNRPNGFSGYRTSSHNWHLAWIPIYLTKSTNSETTDALINILEELSRGFQRKPIFQGISLGLATDCLWGFKPPLDSRNTTKEPTDLELAEVRKKIRTEKQFLLCLTGNGFSETQLNTLRFSPFSDESNVLQKKAIRTSCFNR